MHEEQPAEFAVKVIVLGRQAVIPGEADIRGVGGVTIPGVMVMGAKTWLLFSLDSNTAPFPSAVINKL